MGRNQKQQYQVEHDQQGQDSAKTFTKAMGQDMEEVVPGVPVIRNSTPRPLSFDTMASYAGYFQHLQPSPSAFPEQAPVAPPLPEELAEHPNEHELAINVAIPPTPHLMLSEGQQEFIWLFEYGLEMDPAMLNSNERLNGCALLYGPAMLKGYTLLFGTQHVHGDNIQMIVAIIPSIDPDAEVWGVVYRIPQHLAVPTDKRPSLLDTIHAAITPHNHFQGIPVVVHEIYGDQEISAVTYVATSIACQELQLVLPGQLHVDPLFVQRLTAIARGHKLPQSYISQYSTNQHNPPQNHATADAQAISQASQGMQSIPSTQIPPSMLSPTHLVTGPAQMLPLDEQNTDPLPVVKDTLHAQHSVVQKSATPLHTQWSLIIFSVYLAVLFFLLLTCAILQGMGFAQGILTNGFTPLGVPWLVIMYGLLGGCISSILTQARLRAPHLPLFVVITWFVRPYIGAVLAMFAYLLLTSGLFIVGQSIQRHMAFFWLVGALAGFCEGWAFRRAAASS
jgi:cation transport regulator ChaC